MPIGSNGTPAWYSEPVDYDADAMRKAFDAPKITVAQAIYLRGYQREEARRFLKRAGIAVLVTAGVLLGAGYFVPAHAQMTSPPIPQFKPPAVSPEGSPEFPRAPGMGLPCGPALALAKQLSDKYSESPIGYGLLSNGNLFQIWISSERKTWTAVATKPDGTSCIVGAGTRWEATPEAIEGSPA